MPADIDDIHTDRMVIELDDYQGVTGQLIARDIAPGNFATLDLHHLFGRQERRLNPSGGLEVLLHPQVGARQSLPRPLELKLGLNSEDK